VLGPSIVGLKEFNPIVTIDAAHMKGWAGVYGKCFIATTCDTLKRLLPIAIGFAQQEDSISWNFFLLTLKEALEKASINFSSVTFVSDRGSGLLQSVHSVFPTSHHAPCLKHLERNLLACVGKNQKVLTSRLFYNAAMATHQSAFESAMGHLTGINAKVASCVLASRPDTWALCKVQFSRYGQFTSNLAEQTNAWFLELRASAAVTAMDQFVRTVQNIFSRRAVEVQMLLRCYTGDDVHPAVCRHLKSSGTFSVIRVGEFEFSVR